MGGTSTSKQTTTQSTTPYGPATDTLNGLLGGIGNLAGTIGNTPSAEQTAGINKVVSDTGSLSPWLMGGAKGLLAGGGATKYDPQITANLDALKNGILGQTAAGNNIGANNPAFMKELNVAGTNAANTVNSNWAAAGRQPGGSPGANANVAGAITNAEAPLIQAQYNTDTGRALDAAQNLYGAGNTTYGLLNGTNAMKNANIQAGTGVASAAVGDDNAALTAMAQRFGIPASELGGLLGMTAPVAQAFGTTNGTQTGEQTMSGAQQFALLAGGLGSLWPKSPISFGAG